MAKQIHNALNLSANDFDMEKFNELVNAFRRTHKSATTIDESRLELEERLEAAKGNLRDVYEKGNWDEAQKFLAEVKRLEAKLGESPEIKVKDYDDSLNALMAFMRPAEQSQNTSETV